LGGWSFVWGLSPPWRRDCAVTEDKQAREGSSCVERPDSTVPFHRWTYVID